MNRFFSNNLKFLREQKKINQQTLAKELNVTLGTISHWENGIRTPNMDTIVKIANYFNVNEDILFKDLKQQSKKSNNFTTHIYQGKNYSVDLISEIPFNNLSENEKKEIIENIMDELYEYKREFNNKDK